jgi:hypothetical protein
MVQQRALGQVADHGAVEAEANEDRNGEQRRQERSAARCAPVGREGAAEADGKAEPQRAEQRESIEADEDGAASSGAANRSAGRGAHSTSFDYANPTAASRVACRPDVL